MIVVGCGGLGSAALYRLARELGSGVVGLEQFALGHDRGASQDHSRIIRLAQHQPQYAALAGPAYAAWAEVEAESQQTLVTRTGGLVIEDREVRRGIDSGTRNIEGYTAVFDEFDVDYELLDADELQSRWPQFRLDGGEQALYQSESGIVDAARANAVHVALARAHGAQVHEHTPVRRVCPDGDGVLVETDDRTYRADRVVVAADAWTNQVLRDCGVRLPLTVTQEQVTYYATPHLAEFSPARFPVFMWHGEHNFYGFPVYGEVATKLGQHMGGHETTADDRTFEPDPVRQKRYARFVEQHLPRFGGPELYTKTCLYTVPPDQDFVLDTVPDHPQITVAVGAGHAYKFAALLGELLADLALDRAPAHPIEAFSLTRRALTDPTFARSFHV
ncbi:N-methyl-L-tryptophan oxidase [Pseudonocardia sp. RS11V-5]|uniref:N-methyl-L-tryptophan oxidase n=1 Tax=Pseudonocardia terrae TaxID=2905831 RepID=UPI001E31F210|nr:N-methyl-L-tryptophan oxidase [Pseudonocardia terrae]MCE3551473.1 N-methyl-L-tryptophan oxidase [Pseudonocardia terrae]